MPEITGIDHIYITVSDLTLSEQFYDALMAVLKFRKTRFLLGNEQHIQYYNRHFGFVLRPATSLTTHNPYAPGLHHLCLRVSSAEDISKIVTKLKTKNIACEEPRLYPDYAPDYFAVFLTDPDGIQLEITNYRQERKQRHDHGQDPENDSLS
jgi:glyoxylase I family protein